MYEEFPEEFAQLKAVLDAEDFEAAQKVLEAILVKKPGHQQATFDLERVQGRIGSIANYAFRVNAFLDQGDLAQAQFVLNEASAKFQKNAGIAALRQEIAQRMANKGAAAEVSGPSDDLPNLQTFVAKDDSGGGGGGAPKPLKLPGMAHAELVACVLIAMYGQR